MYLLCYISYEPLFGNFFNTKIVAKLIATVRNTPANQSWLLSPNQYAMKRHNTTTIIPITIPSKLSMVFILITLFSLE